jgi:SpoVK/Ycf46/Vps4 family AAA+-type ATPase
VGIWHTVNERLFFSASLLRYSALSSDQQKISSVSIGAAQRVTTRLEWSDLVLPDSTMQRIGAIRLWLEQQHRSKHEAGGTSTRTSGFRALFRGPSGTGKTLTATLLGKHAGQEVFRIDLAAVVSKFIGETEKNLSRLFDKAASEDWILFFDEADALFGKRTDIKDAHDRYANQEVSLLLRKMEEFDGLAIVACNPECKLDDASLRRFNAVITFDLPTKISCN